MCIRDSVLSAGMLVIADEKKPVALAGVMGGANSEIKDTTSVVVFESANFMGSSVRITSRALGTVSYTHLHSAGQLCRRKIV